MRIDRHVPGCWPLIAALLLAACGGDPGDGGDHGHEHGEGSDHGGAAPPSPGRVEIPALVRRNLGITFAEAEYRPVAATVVIPGSFETLPAGHRDHVAPIAGTCTVHVAVHERVEPGQLLVEIRAPAWRMLRAELADVRARRAAGRRALAEARAARAAAGDLGEAGDDVNDVYAAAIVAAEAEIAAADERAAALLERAAALTGLDVAALRAEEDGLPRWRRMETIRIRAREAGFVREVDVASGIWVEPGDALLHVVDPRRVHFHGQALQADLIDRLRDGQPVELIPPEGRGATRREGAVEGRLHLGTGGNPSARTYEVYVDVEEPRDWIRADVAAFAEVVVAGSRREEELAIPVRAVIRDGTDRIFFRRLPDDPGAVVRVVADLGPSDGRWVTVYSGIGAGDEVVVDGAYQLKIETSESGSQLPPGWHMHADGSLHKDH